MYFIPPAQRILRQRRSRSTASDRIQRPILEGPRSINPRLHPNQPVERQRPIQPREIGQPPRDELYRVSRRRIVGSVLDHEKEEEERKWERKREQEWERKREQEWERKRELELERKREQELERKREQEFERKREKEWERKREQERERVPSDEGIYLQSGSSYSSSSSLLSNPPKSTRRYRSAEPMLMTSSTFQDRSRFSEPSSTRTRSASHTSLHQYNPERPDCSYFYPKRPVRVSESEASLATIREVGGNQGSDGRRKVERRVSEKRLFRIASMHQLPRISAVVVPRVNHAENEISDEDETEIQEVVETKPLNRFIKHRSLSTNHIGPRRQMAAPTLNRNAPIHRSFAARGSDDLSFASSSSDRGICVHSTSDLRDFDTDRLIGFRDRYSRREDEEEAISLAFLYESAAVYKYRAARGQREREQEIYEVLPPSIEVCTICKSGGKHVANSNKTLKPSSKPPGKRLIRKQSFYY